MTALLWMLVVAAAPDAGQADVPKAGMANVIKSLSKLSKPGHEGVTQCSACHATSSWSEVRFNHERTGFSLTGRHERTSCKACHVTDFSVPLPRTCVGCHRDVHSGELGARCESCHDTTDWRSRFDADAHRRTNFPLFGAHAAIPCVECHGEARERRFSRATVDCAACHRDAALRTVGQAVDHLALGLDTQRCQQCHGALSFTPARFVTHDACFPISAGAHAGVPCLGCHSATTPPVSTCRTNTATLCVSCHTNGGGAGPVSETDALHANKPNAMGYSYVARKCAECHRQNEGLP